MPARQATLPAAPGPQLPGNQSVPEAAHALQSSQVTFKQSPQTIGASCCVFEVHALPNSMQTLLIFANDSQLMTRRLGCVPCLTGCLSLCRPSRSSAPTFSW